MKNFFQFSEVKDLIKKCLSIRPSDRPSLEDILSQPWLAQAQLSVDKLAICTPSNNMLSTGSMDSESVSNQETIWERNKLVEPLKCSVLRLKTFFNEPMQVLALHFLFQNSRSFPTDGYNTEKQKLWFLGILEVEKRRRLFSKKPSFLTR